MRRFTALRVLVLLPALAAAAPAQAQSVLFADDFEQGSANWTMEPHWHLAEAAPLCLTGKTFPSGTHCMWYGREDTCDYSFIITVQELRLVEPIALPTQGGGILLDFWSRTETEGGPDYDRRKVEVSTDGGSAWTVVFQLLVPSEPWTPHTVDLGAYAGQTIDLRFTFESVDTLGNFTIGWLVDDVAVRTEQNIYRLSCFGDGSYAACPCGNASAPGAQAGCLNSLGTAGTLRASGSASIDLDTLRLTGSDMTSTTVLYYQGASLLNGGVGVAYGDGLNCTGGPIRRLASTQNVNGASSIPLPGGPSISAQGQVLVPGTRWYQARYRNAVNYCTPDTFNATNQVRVVWGP